MVEAFQLAGNGRSAPVLDRCLQAQRVGTCGKGERKGQSHPAGFRLRDHFAGIHPEGTRGIMHRREFRQHRRIMIRFVAGFHPEAQPRRPVKPPLKNGIRLQRLGQNPFRLLSHVQQLDHVPAGPRNGRLPQIIPYFNVPVHHASFQLTASPPDPPRPDCSRTPPYQRRNPHPATNDE